MHGRIHNAQGTQGNDEPLWQKKGKKFKTKYFAALKDLYGSVDNGTCDTYGTWEGENCCPSRYPAPDNK